jgi:hypothetical protein
MYLSNFQTERIMSSEKEIEDQLLAYNSLKAPLDAKYQRYREKMDKSKKPEGITLKGAESLFNEADDEEIKGMVKQLSERRILVFLGPVGANHGALRYAGHWDENENKFMDGVMIIDNRYIRNYLGSAGVMAHELRHILDCEETQLKRLDIGISPSDPSSLDNEESQKRANIAHGRVMHAFKFKKSDWSRQLFNEKNYTNVDPRFAQNWTHDERAVVEMNDNLKLYLAEKPKLTKQKCGRPCKDFKGHGFCDRKLFYPPCWDHKMGEE